jgi:hypothetical protein
MALDLSGYYGPGGAGEGQFAADQAAAAAAQTPTYSGSSYQGPTERNGLPTEDYVLQDANPDLWKMNWENMTQDDLLQAGFMGSVPGANPYYPNGPQSGNPALGGDGGMSVGGPPVANSNTGGDPFVSGGNNFGSGGNNTVDPGYGVGAGPDVPLQGYESSTNKDFYQQQFANMRSQQMRNQEREGMAYDARQQAASQDPFEFNSETAFDWYNGGEGLPEVQMGTGQGTEGEWSLNDWATAGETSNADILRAALDKSTFGEGNVALAEGLLAGGGMDNDFSWAQFENPNSVIEAFDGGYGTENENMVRAALNNAFTQAPGGPSTPVGYAKPVSSAGVQ